MLDRRTLLTASGMGSAAMLFPSTTTPRPQSLLSGFHARDIATSGATIHCEVGGSGPPLLLLHGYPQTHIIWSKIAPRLAQKFL